MIIHFVGDTGKGKLSGDHKSWIGPCPLRGWLARQGAVFSSAPACFMARLAAMMRSDMVTSNRPSVDGAFRSRFPVPRPVARLGGGAYDQGPPHARRADRGDRRDHAAVPGGSSRRQFPAADRWRLWSGFLVDNVDAQATGRPLLTLAAECLLVGSKAQ
jgi:hypothetical protein